MKARRAGVSRADGLRPPFHQCRDQRFDDVGRSRCRGHEGELEKAISFIEVEAVLLRDLQTAMSSGPRHPDDPQKATCHAIGRYGVE
jgi:hypothetical protein